MKFRPRLLVVTCTLLVGGALLAGADNIASIDADLAPQMVAEEVESLVRAVADPDATDSHGVLKVSVRCTRADRLGAFPTEKGEIDTRTVWVVEVEGEAGSDGAFYVLDDETGAVLAHGAVAAQ